MFSSWQNKQIKNRTINQPDITSHQPITRFGALALAAEHGRTHGHNVTSNQFTSRAKLRASGVGLSSVEHRALGVRLYTPGYNSLQPLGLQRFKASDPAVYVGNSKERSRGHRRRSLSRGNGTRAISLCSRQLPTRHHLDIRLLSTRPNSYSY